MSELRFDVAQAARNTGNTGPDPVTAFRGEHAFLGNPHPCMIWFESVTYPSAEHAFHAAKSLDWAQREHIAGLPGWRAAKQYGRTVVRLRPGWDQLRCAVMFQVQLCKYVQHPDLAAALLATGNRFLLEGNWWGDTDWGAVPHGHPEWSPDLPAWHASDGTAWAGRNWLGTALMMTREMLSQGRA